MRGGQSTHTLHIPYSQPSKTPKLVSPPPCNARSSSFPITNRYFSPHAITTSPHPTSHPIPSIVIVIIIIIAHAYTLPLHFLYIHHPETSISKSGNLDNSNHKKEEEEDDNNKPPAAHSISDPRSPPSALSPALSTVTRTRSSHVSILILIVVVIVISAAEGHFSKKQNPGEKKSAMWWRMVPEPHQLQTRGAIGSY